VPSRDAPKGLKTVDLVLLVGFTLKPGLSPEYLATRLDVRGGRAKRSVRRLVKAGLIAPFTGNQSAYAPTPRGANIARDWIESHGVAELGPDVLQAAKG
jgi:DNA-binding MarR family transcriptional regulator